MTGNQIAYHNAIETERWHKATEQETVRHNKTTESIQSRANELQETALATQRKLADETIRHNVINEQLTNAYNAAMISKSYADSAVSYANAGYLQERSATEAFQRNLLDSQTRLNYASIPSYSAKVRNLNASTELIKAQTKTETMKPILNGVDTVTRGIANIGNFGVSVGRILGLVK